MFSQQSFQQARLARDARFDGLFYVGVKTTGIYCRPICPAPLAKEQNVDYFASALAAAKAGYRPCLRCRPESAPGSPAWCGSDTTLKRAVRLIDEGALVEGDQQQLCDRLGISSRYLRKLFQRIGISPKQYALYQQVLFAKNLLHQTELPIASVALQAGFQSVRRFQDEFKKQLQLTPSQIRGRRMNAPQQLLTLELSYRPPLAWQHLLHFWRARTLHGVEWVIDNRYGRTFRWQQQAGWFEVEPIPDKDALRLSLFWPHAQGLSQIVAQIRRLLDLDADTKTIDQHLQPFFADNYLPGVRIPGVWDLSEAALRAILGQQVSVAGARCQLNRLCEVLGQTFSASESGDILTPDGHIMRTFPSDLAILQSDLAMLKIPAARRATILNFVAERLAAPSQAPSEWLKIKGIGPWTISYAQLRGQAAPDCWLAGDLGIQKALQQRADSPFNAEQLSPWRSYATFQLWFNLATFPKAKQVTTGVNDGKTITQIDESDK